MKTENSGKYLEIMKSSRHLIDSESGVTSLEHQLHTRIYNSSFCSLLLCGSHCDYREIGNRLVITLAGVEYPCPVQIVKQILRERYDEITSKCLNAPAEKSEAASFEKVFNVTKDMDFDLENYDFSLPEITESSVDVTLTSAEQDPATAVIGSVLSSPAALPGHADALSPERGPKLIREDFAEQLPADTAGVTEETSSAFTPASRSGITSVELMAVPSEVKEPRFHAKWELSETGSGTSSSVPSKEKRFLFWPFDRKKNVEPASDPETDQETVRNSEPSVKRPFVRFQPKASFANAFPEPVVLPAEEKPQIALSLHSPAPLRDYTHDSGELFMHRHIVTLKKRLGSDMIGPFRFTFWPTCIPDSGNGFAEMLVHVIDDAGKKEELAVLDKQQHEKIFSFDGKELKAYGIWNNGTFESHISLCGPTASIFDLVEDVKVSLPEKMTDNFLSQFRLEKKGQPKLFIVPFSSSNRGEQTIPIIGYAEVKGVRHALKRMEGNTLKYTYDGRLKIVTGHFDLGRFTFSTDSDIVRFPD